MTICRLLPTKMKATQSNVSGTLMCLICVCHGTLFATHTRRLAAFGYNYEQLREQALEGKGHGYC
jgi:hypothetical protein